MGTPLANRYGMGADGMFCPPKDLAFEVDAEMIIYGNTRPDARVTMRGEPVRLRPDGTFTVRMSLPNQRQVIPVVAFAAVAPSSGRLCSPSSAIRRSWNRSSAKPPTDEFCVDSL